MKEYIVGIGETLWDVLPEREKHRGSPSLGSGSFCICLYTKRSDTFTARTIQILLEQINI